MKMEDDNVRDDEVTTNNDNVIDLNAVTDQDDIDELLDNEMQRKLYKMYEESPSKCLKECERIGYSDRIIDKIVTKFQAQISTNVDENLILEEDVEL